MPHFILTYEIASDYLARRASFPQLHLRHAWAAAERGELLLGGAVGDSAESALLLFDAASPAVAEAFARADPYVTNGLVVGWQVRRWTTVVGAGASTPVMPDADPA